MLYCENFMFGKIVEGFVQSTISTASSEAVENALKLTNIAGKKKAKHARIVFEWLIGCLAFDPPLFIASTLIGAAVEKLTTILGCSEKTADLLTKTTKFVVLNRGEINMSNLLCGLGFLGGVPAGKKLEEFARTRIMQGLSNIISPSIPQIKQSTKKSH